MNAIVKASNASQLSSVTADAWDALKNSLYPGKSDEAVHMVISYCAARGYDPLKKPVHLVKMWNSDLRREIEVVLPGINQYRIDAARTGQYAGKSEPEFGPMVTDEFTTKDKRTVRVTYPEWCRVTVRRVVKGQIAEFTAREYWLECYATQGRDATAPNAMWERRARGQLAKVAEAQALRMAFPEEMSDYTAEEMEGRVHAPQPAPMPPARGPQVDSVAEEGPAVAWRAYSQTGKQITSRDVNHWVKCCTAYVALLENAAAVVGWRQSMEPIFEELREHEPKAVEHVEGLAQDRMDELAEEEARQAEAAA